jgi:hypothetical protein
MNAWPTKKVLEQMIVAAERRLEFLRAIHNVADEDPAFIREFMQALGAPDRPRTGNSQEPQSSPGFDRVRSFLESRGDEWVPTPEILRATGIARSALARILYRTHRGAFVKRKAPGSNKLKQWRLAKGGDGSEGQKSVAGR